MLDKNVAVRQGLDVSTYYNATINNLHLLYH